MEVTIYGVRGSTPVPGPSTVRYGGNTVCVAARLADGTRLFVDAGSGLRLFGRDLLAERWTGPLHFLLSHMHYDHVIGLPFFTPIYMPQTQLVIHPIRRGGKDGLSPGPQIFDGVHTPVAFDKMPSKVTLAEHDEDPWRIGSARISRIDLNHPGGAQGFRIDDEDGASFVYLTDNELDPPGPAASTPEQQAAFSRGAGLLICDAQYLPEDLPLKRGWGHSTVPQVLNLGRLAQPLTQLLFHHDPDRDDVQLDSIAEQAAAFAATEMSRGPILVAAEGMRFRVRADSVERLPDGQT